MRKIVYVAIIGSRTLPEELFEKAVTLTNKRIWALLYKKAKEELGLGDKYHHDLTKEQQRLVNKKTNEYTLVIRSGNAIGMDQVAYEIKRANHVHIYLPYSNYNRGLLPDDSKVKSIASGTDKKVDTPITKLVNWYDRMNDAYRLYIRRNYHIINGFDEKAPQVDLVVMYAPTSMSGKVTGGTYYGYRFAAARGIQVHNIYDDLHEPDLDNIEVVQQEIVKEREKIEDKINQQQKNSPHKVYEYQGYEDTKLDQLVNRLTELKEAGKIQAVIKPTKKYTGTLFELLGSVNEEELIEFWSK